MLKNRLNPLKMIGALMVLGATAACATTGQGPVGFRTAGGSPGATADARIAGDRVPIGGAATPPGGFLDFCRRSPDDCRSSARPAALADLAAVRTEAASLFWAGVFGRPNGPVTAPAAPGAGRRSGSGSGSAFDWTPVFGGNANSLRRTASFAPRPEPAGVQPGVSAISAKEMTPASDAGASLVESSAPVLVVDGAPAVADHGRDTVDRPASAVALQGGEPLVRSDPAPTVVVLDKTMWALAHTINRQVNRRIRQAPDADVYGAEDYWAAPAESGARGDCEDYVLAKRRAMIEAGIPAEALSIAIVRTHWGESHAVLLLAADTGDFVLDSLTPRILRWDRVDYEWRERQAPGKIFAWVRMDG